MLISRDIQSNNALEVGNESGKEVSEKAERVASSPMTKPDRWSSQVPRQEAGVARVEDAHAMVVQQKKL